MLRVLRSHHGGFAVGVSLAGRGLWIQREPRYHQWRLWRTRVPSKLAIDPPGGEGEAPSGVREPRRPPPSGSGAEIALDPSRG